MMLILSITQCVSVFRSWFSMKTNGVFCFVLVRIDLFHWAPLLFQPFWPDIWPNRVQNGQKRPFWAISGAGGSKLVNKGGTSQGTSPVMHLNRFGGQGGPSGCARGPPK